MHTERRVAPRAVYTVVLALVLTAAGVSGAEYSWQRPQAVVIPTGDLEWAPHPFVFQAGQEVRYIDFQGGSDNNDGKTKATPWKHHPWDPNATGKAAACTGVDTYIFKRGVAYRGALTARESGRSGHPIRLTSDPSWGEGEAAIYGSREITGGWKRLNAVLAPAGMPEPDKVWFIDLGKSPDPKALYETGPDGITRIPLARTPNWTVSNPDDVKAGWAVWEDVETGKGPKRNLPQVQVGEDRSIGIDSRLLTAPGADAYAGATVWTEYVGLMGTPFPVPVESYDPAKHAIEFASVWSGNHHPIRGCRYYLENSPRFLDSPGEYWFDAMAGRLYVRLPGDRDPNAAVLEVPREVTLVDIPDQSHIEVSGLTFRIQRRVDLYHRFWDVLDEDPSCVKVRGAADDIRIANNRFEDVVRAVWVAAGAPGKSIDDISVTDNEIDHCDNGAIDIAGGPWQEGQVGGTLGRVDVLRNRLHDIGGRPRRANQGHALVVQFPELLTVAGNVLDRCYGAGLFLFGGKPSGQPGEAPLTRMLVYDNKVTDPLLSTNDWGGIETWQGGPAYVFDNVSINPGGYMHCMDQVTNADWKPWWTDMAARYPAKEFPFFGQLRAVVGGWDMNGGRNYASARFGFAYYMDGGFKQYQFNNVALGKSNDLTSPLCNTGALLSVGSGFMHSVFNNTYYRFGICSSAGDAGPDYYLGNLWDDISDMYFHHSDAAPKQDSWLHEAYGFSVFGGKPRSFGVFEKGGPTYPTLGAFSKALERYQPIVASVGAEAASGPLRDPAAGDVRPTQAASAAGRGVRFFLPWGLYGVVGEWQFRRAEAHPADVLDEHWYMTEAYVERGMYHLLPRYDLTAHGVTADDYVDGPLEDWVPSALTLNGRDQYLGLSDADLRSDVKWGDKPDQTFPGDRRKTVDMGTNNFLIEALVRVEPGSTGGLVCKASDTGYVLDLDDAGRPRVGLLVGGRTVASRAGAAPIDDGRWHHVLVEVDRAAPQGMAVYVDGKRSDGAWQGAMPAKDVSLANRADFLVGRRPDGGYLHGAFDFLRVSRGTLADARTSIDELYQWEFHGPFLQDFTGRERDFGRSAAGAIGLGKER